MFGLLISLVAGFLTPYFEKPLAEPLAKAIGQQIKIEHSEMRLLAFMLALLIAAVVCAALDAGGMLSVVIGTSLGYFGTRIVEMVKAAVDGRPKD